MSLIADGILILTCLTTALYCYVLSRRLHKLSNTDEGIGQQIKQMNAALEETRGAQRDMNTQAKAASDKLMREVASARKAAKDMAARLEEATVTIAALERANASAARGYPAEAPEPGPAPDIVAVEQTPQAAHPTAKSAPEQAAAMPKSDPVVPDDDDEDDDDDDSIGLQDALEGGAGEQQLGFLPDIDVKLGDEDAVEESDDVSNDASEESDVMDRSVREAAAADGNDSMPPPPVGDVAAKGGDRGLLKVERVAL